MRVGIPCVKSGEKFYISPHFGRAPYFALYEVSEEGVKLVKIEENPHGIKEHRGGEGRLIIDLLLKNGVEGVVVYGIGSGAFYRLRENGVKIFAVDKFMPVEEALELLRTGKLKEAEKPLEHD